VTVRIRILKNEEVSLLLSAVRPATAGWMQKISCGFRRDSHSTHVRCPQACHSIGVDVDAFSAVRPATAGWMQRISCGFGRDSHSAHVRCPQACHAMGVDVDAFSAVRPATAGWMQRISFGFWRGFHAKITGRFSDDGALRTTRAGLVSASGRPQRAGAEKMPVGFRAAKIRKKSSLSSPRPLTAP
jgi:hypothetical protein